MYIQKKLPHAEKHKAKVKGTKKDDKKPKERKDANYK